MSEVKHPGEPAGPAGAGHEVSDLKPRSIALFGAVLAGTIILCLIVSGWIFGVFARRQATEDAPPSPLAKTEAPAGPRLQVFAPKDLQEIRAAEDATLNRYGWVNKEAGIVRIPIDRAMRLLARRGLPAPAQQAPLGKAKGK